MTIHDDDTGLTSKITRQCSSNDDLEEVVAILREILLGLGYQPASIAKFIRTAKLAKSPALAPRLPKQKESSRIIYRI